MLVNPVVTGPAYRQGVVRVEDASTSGPGQRFVNIDRRDLATVLRMVADDQQTGFATESPFHDVFHKRTSQTLFFSPLCGLLSNRRSPERSRGTF